MCAEILPCAQTTTVQIGICYGANRRTHPVNLVARTARQSSSSSLSLAHVARPYHMSTGSIAVGDGCVAFNS